MMATEILPPNLSDWGKVATTLNGRLCCTARRSGVTVLLVRDTEGWWHITKLKGGQVLRELSTKRIPDPVYESILEARRR